MGRGEEADRGAFERPDQVTLGTEAVPFLRSTLLDSLPGVLHGFSFELASDAQQERFPQLVGLGEMRTVRLHQVHGSRVVDADGSAAIGGRCEGDALVTSRRGVAIAVATADCVPTLLVDVAASVFGAVHAGWRGMCAGVLASGVDRMKERGADPARLRAAIGPAVGASCYEVGEEVREAFADRFPGWRRLFRGRRLDLVQAAIDELLLAGLSETSIDVIGVCTHCDRRLASHRRQGSKRGTNLAIIGAVDSAAAPSGVVLEAD